MAGRKSDFTLTKLDDLFSTQEQRDEEKLSKIRDIPLTEIDDFPDHPFKVRDDEDKQSAVPGQDCETICGLLDSVGGKLDDVGGDQPDSGSGQLMAFINAPTGRICSWGIPLAEAYGVRLPADYDGPVPPQMQIMDVPEGEYIVFEHGPFDFETENQTVEAEIEQAMREFDYEKSGYRLDTTPDRVFYFYHDCKRFWKYVRPIKRV